MARQPFWTVALRPTFFCVLIALLNTLSEKSLQSLQRRKTYIQTQFRVYWMKWNVLVSVLTEIYFHLAPAFILCDCNIDTGKNRFDEKINERTSLRWTVVRLLMELVLERMSLLWFAATYIKVTKLTILTKFISFRDWWQLTAVASIDLNLKNTHISTWISLRIKQRFCWTHIQVNFNESSPHHHSECIPFISAHIHAVES